jgi:hypothetical protein
LHTLTAVSPFSVLIAAVMSVLLLYAIGRGLGWGTLPASSAACTLAFSSAFWISTATARPVIFVVVFMLVALGAMVWWIESRRPAIIVTVPATGVVGAAVFAYFARSFEPASGWLIADRVALTGRLSALASGAATDLGVLGVAFVVGGAIVLARRQPRVLALSSGLLAAFVVGATSTFVPDERGALVLALVPLCLVIGAGMNWTMASGVMARPIAAVLVALLPVIGAVAHAQNGWRARGTTMLEAGYLTALKAVAPAQAVLVGEDADPAAIRRSLQAGVPLIGLAGARANLEEFGFRFTPVAGAGVPMSIDAYLDAVPKGWIIAAATGDRFGLSVPPGRGATFGAVGGRIDLFGHARLHFGIIGVSGARGARRARGESESAEPVRLEVLAGDDLGGGLRAPASLAVLSDDHGGVIHYKGIPVAASQTGLALALVSPDGELRDAVSVESTGDMRIVVNPPMLAAASITGAEPCVDVTSAAWADVTPLAMRSSLGGLLDGPSNVVIYVRSLHPLSPRQRPLSHDEVTDVSVKEFRTAKPSERTALDAAIAADGLGDKDLWLDAPFVYRLTAESAARGRRQIAIELGGFAAGAAARVFPTQRGPVSLCAAMRANTPSSSMRMPAVSGSVDINISSRDLFLFGWGRVEGEPRAPFRWTRTPEAELLLPLERTAPMLLELECVPIGQAPVDLRLRINDLTLPSASLVSTQRIYRWNIPADALMEGLNRVWIGTSALVRPMDIGPGDDDRQLGVAVHRIRLTPLSRQQR